MTATGPERRALSRPVPPASTVLRIPLRGTRLRRAVDPGASTGPAGLTARARQKARPNRRAANLTIGTLGNVQVADLYFSSDRNIADLFYAEGYLSEF